MVTSARRQLRRAPLGVLLSAPFLAQADATIANVAIPSIQRELQASASAAELVIGGYLIAYAVLLITGARLGQTHGYKRIFMLGMGVFAAASLFGGLAPNVTVLVAMRVVQGAGAALMFPQALTGIQLNFAGSERTRAISLYGLALSGGAFTGQVLGGILVSADVAGTGWRSIFLVNVPACAVALGCAARHLPADHGGDARKVDLVGVAALSAAVSLIVLPLILGRPASWPTWTWVSLAASMPALGVFVITQRRASTHGRSPLISLQIFTRPTIRWSLLSLATASGTYYALLFVLAQYVQNGLGRSSLVSGFVLIPWVAAFGLAGQTVRRLPGRATGPASVAGGALLTAAYLAISHVAGFHDVLMLLPVLAAGGFGIGTQYALLLGRLTNAVPPQFASDISGVSTTMLQLGGALGVAAFGTLYVSEAVPQGPSQAFAVSALGLGGTAACGAVFAWLAFRGGETHRQTAGHASRRTGHRRA